MLALLIIALLIGIAALAVAVYLFSKVKGYSADAQAEKKEIASLKNAVKGVQLRVTELENEGRVITFDSLKGFAYDEKNNTITVEGNLRADGYIEAGGRKL